MNNEFPVPSETVLTITCNEGYQLNGDETVTCTKGIEFQYSTEPKCGKIRKPDMLSYSGRVLNN